MTDQISELYKTLASWENESKNGFRVKFQDEIERQKEIRQREGWYTASLEEAVQDWWEFVIKEKNKIKGKLRLLGEKIVW